MKGFGVDKVAEYLESENFSNYFVEIGGEARARETMSANKLAGWRYLAGAMNNIQKVVWLQK
ncbi:MAG: FAD:protein FMN transferase [Calditrichia bacterium]